MLKQGVKTMLNLFKHVHYPNFLLSSSDLMQPCFQASSHFDIHVKKSKKILKMSLDLMPLFKTSVDVRVKGLALNVDYLENQCHNFIQKNMRRLQNTYFLFSEL